MVRALLIGTLSSFFFSFTFILNRSMHLSGGYWIWSGSLRYLFTLPILALLVHRTYGLHRIHSLVRQQLGRWLLWSTVGFGLFYAPLCFAGDYGESWLVAASWQITIVAGVFLTPLFGKKIEVRNLFAAMIILSGVLLLQIRYLEGLQIGILLSVLLPILIAAVSYPLGNRKMMQLCDSQVTTLERVYGMTLCSMPFWMLLSVVAVGASGLPSLDQTGQSLLTALFSGIIATILFFYATDSVKQDHKRLAVVESTQAGEVIFSLLGGLLLLQDPLPDAFGYAGIALIVAGIVVNSTLSNP